MTRNKYEILHDTVDNWWLVFESGMWGKFIEKFKTRREAREFLKELKEGKSNR